MAVLNSTMGGGQPSPIYDVFAKGDEKKIVLFRGTRKAAVKVNDNLGFYLEAHGWSGWLCFPKMASHPQLLSHDFEKSKFEGEVYSDLHQNTKDMLYEEVNENDWYKALETGGQ